jgi:hypothetical protein
MFWRTATQAGMIRRVRTKLAIAAITLLIVSVFVLRTHLLRRHGQSRTPPEIGRTIAEVDFDNTPLTEALAQWSRAAGVRVEADWPSLRQADLDPDTRVTLRLFNRPARQVLSAILESCSRYADQVRYHWRPDGVVRLVLAEHDQPDPADLRMYDVSPLLGHFGTTLRPTLLPKPGSMAATWGTFPFEGERFYPIESLVIQSIDSNSWRQNSGPIGGMTEAHGRLFVFQTAENHRRIERALGDLQWVQQTLDRQLPVTAPLDAFNVHDAATTDLLDWHADEESCRTQLDTIVPELVLDPASLPRAIAHLQEKTHANIVVDWAALAVSGVQPGGRQRLRLSNLSLRQMLNILTLTFSEPPGEVIVWSASNGLIHLRRGGFEPQERAQPRLIYDVRDFTERLLSPNELAPPSAHGQGLFAQTSALSPPIPAPPTPLESELHRRNTTAADAAKAAGKPVSNLSRDECIESLCRLIEEQIDPNSWRDNGGNGGALREADGLLFITQTAENHRLVSSQLANLRRVRDQIDHGDAVPAPTMTLSVP